MVAPVVRGISACRSNNFGSAGFRSAHRGRTHESSTFLDGKLTRDDITVKDGILLQFAAVGDRDVSFDFTEDHDRSGLDVADNFGVFTDGEIAFGVYFAFDPAINNEIV